MAASGRRVAGRRPRRRTWPSPRSRGRRWRRRARRARPLRRASSRRPCLWRQGYRPRTPPAALFARNACVATRCRSGAGSSARRDRPLLRVLEDVRRDLLAEGRRDRREVVEVADAGRRVQRVEPVCDRWKRRYRRSSRSSVFQSRRSRTGSSSRCREIAWALASRVARGATGNSSKNTPMPVGPSS